MNKFSSSAPYMQDDAAKSQAMATRDPNAQSPKLGVVINRIHEHALALENIASNMQQQADRLFGDEAEVRTDDHSAATVVSVMGELDNALVRANAAMEHIGKQASRFHNFA